MSKFRTSTLVLFGAATACYLASWTSVGIGLAVLGAVFEIFGWISVFSEPEEKTETNGSLKSPPARPAENDQS